MTDAFGRRITYLRLSVTDRCNLRCQYCMPPQGVPKKSHQEMLTEEETICAVEAAASLGITKLRITGGEPLVKKNILSLCAGAAQVPGIESLCLTTNGTRLSALANDLRRAGVSHLNISVDTLNPEKYAAMTRLGNLDDVWAGLHAALDAGFSKIKLNSVLIGGFNDDEIPALAELTRRYPIDVRFIELMPMVDSAGFTPESFLPCSQVLRELPQLAPLPPDGGVARLYTLPDALGNVGLISPLSAHFCGSCNRLRLTADGKLKPCLHSPEEYSLKGLSREEMRQSMIRAIQAKPLWHGQLDAGHLSQAGRQMNQIGG